MIWLHVYSGLTSRCNTLAQAHELAKRYHEPITIFWEIQEDCNISYKDIFDNKQFSDIKHRVVEYKTALSTQRISRQISILNRRLMKNMFLRFVKLCGGEWVDYAPPDGMSWLGEDMQKRVVKCGRKIIQALDQKRNVFISAFNGLCIPKIDSVSCCREIMFKEKFMRRAETLISDKSMWVGVHIRRTDHLIAKKHSTLGAFMHKMEEIEQADASIRFFLATDDRKVESLIRRTFQDKVCVLREKQWGRNTKKAMECAVIDCLCLSKCNIILGSFGSSYSGFAACFGNRELIVVDKET